MSNNQIPESVRKVLTKLNISDSDFLGKGGEGYVFSYTNDSVVKVYVNTYREYLEGLVKLQKYLADAHLPFPTPEIQEIGNIDGTYYSIEKKLTGVVMEQKFPHVSSKEQYLMLESYYDAIRALNSIELPELPYGNILTTAMAITDSTWQGFLLKILDQRIAIAKERLRKDVINFDAKVNQFQKIIKRDLAIDEKYFVHGDYYVNQVLVDEKNHISAVLDIGIHSVVGDPRQDVASICFFEDSAYIPEHIQFLTNLAVKEYGESILKYNDIYKIYYSFYFSDIYNHNPKTYHTFVTYLNDEQTWRRIS